MILKKIEMTPKYFGSKCLHIFQLSVYPFIYNTSVLLEFHYQKEWNE